MHKNMKSITIFILAHLLSTSAIAQQTAQAPDKKTTLGDLIKKVKDESRQLQINKTQKNSVVVPDTKALFEEKKDTNLAAVKPPKLSEIYESDNKDKIEYEKTLNQQISELYKLTQKFKNSQNRGELWLRLAELYVEKANIVDTRKQNEYDNKLRDFQTGKTQVKPVLDMAEARDFNKKAIQLYEWFLRDFPKDTKVPQALFFLGYNYFELGDGNKGASYYLTLTDKYPTSSFTGEAHFAMGESLFEGEKWVNAYKEYAYLIKDQKNSLHTVALYKAAWCLYRLGKTEEGIKYLDYIVKTGQRKAQQVNSGGGKRINTARLEAESLKDLVIFLADAGDHKRVINYFSSLGIKNFKDYIEKYAYLLADKGNREGAKDVFKYLIGLDPNSKKAFEYQYQIVQNYFFAKNSPDFRLELYRWIISYNAKSNWYKTNETDQAFIEKCNQLRELTLRNYVLQQHQAAQNSRAEFSRQTTEQGYRLYFQEFSKSAQAADMHFYYGELLYDMQKFAEAANEYAAVVDTNPNSQFAEKASQNLLLAIEKVLPKDEELQKKVGNSTDPVPLDPISEKFVKAAKWNLEKFPKSANAGEIRFRVARLYYLTNNFKEAEQYFKEVVAMHPNTKIADYSANLLLDIYNLRNDYNGLEKMGNELLKNEYIANSKTGGDIRLVLEKSSFKRGQNLELEKKFLESAQQFQGFAMAHPKSELAGIAFFNAGVNFERAARNKDAIINYKKVIASNDKSLATFKPKARRLLAKMYQDSGMFEEAGNLYSELVRESPRDPLAMNYQYNSALMFEMAGKSALAVREYNKYRENNQNQAENAAVVFKIANIKRLENKLGEAYDQYALYEQYSAAKPEKKVEATYRMYEINRKLRKQVDLPTVEVKMRNNIQRTPAEKRGVVNTYLAKVKLDQAKETFNKLKSIQIPSNPAKQKAAVDQKLEIVNALNNQLGIIIKLESSEEIVSSLAILGEANQHIADAFLSVPVPSNLNEESKKAYMAEIQKIIAPFQTKAEESFKLSVDRAWELQAYPPEYQRAYAYMNKKNPQQYYDGGESAADVRRMDWMVEND
ncbi:MAG: adventurous gliding motility protein [Pseudobdellovibrio sp.]|jgi:TolA-binding protein|nr:adventurous gliding motility protein [Pseudobdellovibrio sp.]